MPTYRIRKYTKDGKPVFLDLIRETFVYETPEECVRQKVLLDLLNRWGIPKTYIKVEDHTKGIHDRADIVVLHPRTGNNWILYELKAHGISITDDTHAQAIKYNMTRKCDFVCLSNGVMEKWYQVKGSKNIPIEKPTGVKDLLNLNITFTKEKPWLRPGLNDCNNIEFAKSCVEEGVIGEDTPSRIHPFIINLNGLLMEDGKHILKEIKTHAFSIVADGCRSGSFGNAGGGAYDGFYKYYVIQFPNGEHNIISIAIFGLAKNINDPQWGTRNAHTSLNVAIDDFEKRHNSLQLQLDKNLLEKADNWALYHDGTLTSGKSGAVKREDVIVFCKETVPDLIEGSRICLGELPKNKLFTWENSGDLITNLIRYALVRDEFRKQRKSVD